MKLAGIAQSMDIKLQVSSLIDVVFLLLIYFMVTASLIKREGDLSFLIPAADFAVLEEVPLEALIEIQRNGAIQLEGIRFSAMDQNLPALVSQIAGLRLMAASQGAKFHVNLLPEPDARHRRIIDVMDACAKAGVETLGFGHTL